MNTTKASTKTSTLRKLIAALPLAAAAVTLTPGVALADGPALVIAEPGTDPQSPGDIAQPEVTPEPHPQPVNPQDGPKDKAPVPADPQDGPKDKAGPKGDGPVRPGPGEFKNPTCPTHGGGEDCVPDADGGPVEVPTTPEPKKARPQAGDQPRAEVDSVVLPTRVDAGLAAPAAPVDGGLELTWLLAGGALVTASGAAFAARRIRRQS